MRAFGGVREIWSDRPVSVVSPVSHGLLVHPDAPEWIQRRTLLRFDTRTIHTDGEGVLGIVCEARLKNFITAPCSILIERGIPILGPTSPHVSPLPMPVSSPDPRIVGKVVAIEGDTLSLTDNVDGWETVKASDVFLEARREIMDDCVTRLIGRTSQRVLEEASRQAALFHSGPGRRDQIADALRYLREKANLEAVPGAKFVIGEPLSSRDRSFLKIEIIAHPTLLFDPSGTRQYTWKERGLKESGPFDQRTFCPKQLRIAVVCQARHEGRVDGFLANFLDGMPHVLSGAKKEARYGDGFLRRFHLDKPSVRYLKLGEPVHALFLDRYLSYVVESPTTSSYRAFRKTIWSKPGTMKCPRVSFDR